MDDRVGSNRRLNRRLVNRRLRYGVAVSLDGFIAGPNGEFDWIVPDPAIDFAALYRQFDTAVMGRKTYDVARSMGHDGTVPGMDVIVFSRTLPAESHPRLRVTRDDPLEVVANLKKQHGRDIWLFGGGELFGVLLAAGLVDTVEVAVMPVLLGSGIPLMPPGRSVRLVLGDHKVLPGTGIVLLSYLVAGGTGSPPRILHVTSRAKSDARKPAKNPSG
ncbi:MAG TPA: dihydrofolate reductase family protein [Gemmatimonadaceae bacterium]|nr:dihydrofolate reductase family protein [Gemmatimonadaceae bacterium]